MSDDLFTSNQTYHNVSIYRLPLNPWYFMYKVHIQVNQLTVTENTFQFFKAIQKQKEAIGNLFQPISGRIPNNFHQVQGDPNPINGIFYAAGMGSKAKYITNDDIPYGAPFHKMDYDDPYWKQYNINGIGIKCLDLFPNSTSTKPDYWVD